MSGRPIKRTLRHSYNRSGPAYSRGTRPRWTELAKTLVSETHPFRPTKLANAVVTGQSSLQTASVVESTVSDAMDYSRLTSFRMSKICWQHEASPSHTKRFGSGAGSSALTTRGA